MIYYSKIERQQLTIYWYIGIWILCLLLFEVATTTFAVQQEFSKIPFSIANARSRDTASQYRARRCHCRVPLVRNEIDKITNTNPLNLNRYSSNYNRKLTFARIVT